MNKLDEILAKQKWTKCSEYPTAYLVYPSDIEKYNTAIIELIEGEIIGEDEIYVDGMSDEFIERTGTRNDYRRLQRQKLQKLKE